MVSERACLCTERKESLFMNVAPLLDCILKFDFSRNIIKRNVAWPNREGNF